MAAGETAAAGLAAATNPVVPRPANGEQPRRAAAMAAAFETDGGNAVRIPLKVVAARKNKEIAH